MSKLVELSANGMNPRYVTQKLIVDHYHDILVARGNRRTWEEIAGALEVPHGKVALASAWARTRKAVASGKLVIPPKRDAMNEDVRIGDPRIDDPTEEETAAVGRLLAAILDNPSALFAVSKKLFPIVNEKGER
ncbi:hypothetical protein HF289_13870 [Acidithiobacillus ferrooxidans]|uniref:hypothetical protein n=1 Tax=Acidithiobacillus ferrooxidans TaxID=920 RepID=UPI001C07A8E0|nr:hypothetical protein [Acidithiobacillus ferrooxidans]MBU2857902.1 hypothetical protein [Acidithiobacillus ferrooxidans]